MFIITCLLVPIIGIGLYPKVITQIYDSTSHKLTVLLRQAAPSLKNVAVEPVAFSSPEISSEKAIIAQKKKILI